MMFASMDTPIIIVGLFKVLSDRDLTRPKRSIMSEIVRGLESSACAGGAADAVAGR